MYSCKKDDCPNRNKDNYNCSYSSTTDNEVIQCVDKWAEDKFSYLERYLNATSKARVKFSSNGNAVYIDLFSGPGRSRIRGVKQEISGSALRILRIDNAPFNRIILNDLSTENCRALSRRVKRAEIYNGDANTIINDIVDELKKTNYKYHFVFLDPFAPKHLKFKSIKRLSELQRMDIMINFPIGAILRNVPKWISGEGSILDEFLGTHQWREEIEKKSRAQFCSIILSIYLDQLVSISFSKEGLGLIDEYGNEYHGTSIATIKNSRNVVLYYLILVSKHPIASGIWRSIIKIDSRGQRSLL